MTGVIGQAVADLIELYLRDDPLEAWRRAYREGYQAAEAAHQDDYHRGYVDGLLRRKHIEHDAVEAAKLEALRWGPGGRSAFGEPRPGDFTGRGIKYVRALQARGRKREGAA
jgi:hypothetical protein